MRLENKFEMLLHEKNTKTWLMVNQLKGSAAINARRQNTGQCNMESVACQKALCNYTNIDKMYGYVWCIISAHVTTVRSIMRCACIAEKGIFLQSQRATPVFITFLPAFKCCF